MDDATFNELTIRLKENHVQDENINVLIKVLKGDRLI